MWTAFEMLQRQLFALILHLHSNRRRQNLQKIQILHRVLSIPKQILLMV
jgi:hypothetical protein